MNPESTAGIPQTFKVESFETICNGFSIVAKPSILDVCGSPCKAV